MSIERNGWRCSTYIQWNTWCCHSVIQSSPTLCNPMDGGLNYVLWPPLSPRVCSDSCPLSRWCYLTFLSSAAPCPFASVFLSINVFSNESALHIRWPKDWSFSFSISPSNEYSRLVSFRIHWFDLLALQGTLKAELQHHNPKASISLCSLFFMDQHSHPFFNHILSWLLEKP